VWGPCMADKARKVLFRGVAREVLLMKTRRLMPSAPDFTRLAAVSHQSYIVSISVRSVPEQSHPSVSGKIESPDHVGLLGHDPGPGGLLVGANYQPTAKQPATASQRST
jgi:hypothetical protein